MIVADTNPVAYLVIPGPHTADAERVRANDHEWVAPILLRYELLNVIAKYLRGNRIDRDAALKLHRRGRSSVELRDLPCDPLEILRMFEMTGYSPYDLEFVWLAIKIGAAFVTADAEVVRAFPDTAVHFDAFAMGSNR